MKSHRAAPAISANTPLTAARSALAAFGAGLALAGSALAATPEQITRAQQCHVSEQGLARAAAIEPALAALRTKADYLIQGAGPAEVTEFFDYSCPACRAIAPQLHDLAARNVITWRKVDFPVLARKGNLSDKAAWIAIAAGRRDKAAGLAFAQAMIAKKGKISEKLIASAAAEAKIDYAALAAAAADPKLKQFTDANIRLGEALGVPGTPGLIVEGVLLTGGDSSNLVFSCLISAAIAAKRGA